MFEEVKARTDELAELIESERYEDAATAIGHLDAAVRGFTRNELVSLDKSQQTYLYQLATWLTDEDGKMEIRSRRLIDVIAPFNENKVLKFSKQYQVKRSNG